MIHFDGPDLHSPCGPLAMPREPMPIDDLRDYHSGWFEAACGLGSTIGCQIEQAQAGQWIRGSFGRDCTEVPDHRLAAAERERHIRHALTHLRSEHQAVLRAFYTRCRIASCCASCGASVGEDERCPAHPVSPVVTSAMVPSMMAAWGWAWSIVGCGKAADRVVAASRGAPDAIVRLGIRCWLAPCEADLKRRAEVLTERVALLELASGRYLAAIRVVLRSERRAA